jgi:hypothetical protein
VKNRLYLGDGVYVAQVYDALILTTENGIETTNSIVLEPEVIHALEVYISHIRRDSDAP